MPSRVMSIHLASHTGKDEDRAACYATHSRIEYSTEMAKTDRHAPRPALSHTRIFCSHSGILFFLVFLTFCQSLWDVYM